MTNESGAVDARDWYVDGDGDTYGAGAPVRACTAPAGRVDRAGDCRNNDAAFHPYAAFHPLPTCPDDVCGSPPYFCGSHSCAAIPFPAIPPGWDYNCNGTEDPEYGVLPAGTVTSCRVSGGFCFGPTYLTSPPVCGATQTLSACSVGGATCARATREVVVGCR